eukprot:12201515-Alexandrium_andersonii.AAC.1
MLAEHKVGAAQVQIGACDSEASLHVSVMRRARDFGARVFSDGSRVYEVSRLQSFKGVASK